MGHNPNTLPAKYRYLSKQAQSRYLSAIQAKRERPATARKSTKNNKRLENKFLYIWEMLKGPKLDREFLAIEGRNFRWDFHHDASGILIEIQGGIWGRGKSGHSTGKGIQRDCEKQRMATLAGFKPIAFTEKEINATEIEKVIAFCR